MSFSATMPAHLLVPGLEDLAGATFAQAIEQKVRPKQQFGAATLEHLIHLIRGQPVAPEQLLGQGTRFGEAVRPARESSSSWA